jgi:hypothetical protein
MRSIDDTLSDLLYDQERMLQHEIEDLSPVWCGSSPQVWSARAAEL